MVSRLKELIDEPELAHTEDPHEIFITSVIDWQIYGALLAKIVINDRS